MNIDFTKQSVGSLVARRENGTFITASSLFCTISPNPNAMLKVFKGRKFFKMKYGLLPHKIQYQYCLRVLNSCYLPFLSEDCEIVGTWELNKTNNIHLHFILNDKMFDSEQRFNSFRRDVSCCSMVRDNMSKKTDKDYMNNIVRVTKSQDDLLDYLDKDHEKDPILDNYYKFNEKPITLEKVKLEFMSLEKYADIYYNESDIAC